MKSSNEYEYIPIVEGNRVLANTPSGGNSNDINQRKKLSMISATRSLGMENKNIKNDDKLFSNEDTNIDTDEYLDYTVKFTQIEKDDALKHKNTERAISMNKVQKYSLKVYVTGILLFQFHKTINTTFLPHAFR